MSKLKPSQALGMWALTAIILFLLASLSSWSISDWKWFSKIIFWGPTIILGVWTINDYFINSGKEISNENYREKQFQQENKLSNTKFDDIKNTNYTNTTTFILTQKEETSEFQNETSETLRRLQETAERIKSNMAEIEKLDKEIVESDYKFERVNSKYDVQIGKQIWTVKNFDLDEFRNGDKIIEAKTRAEWIECLKKKKPAFCYYDNNKKHSDGYGKLYNYYAIMDQRGLAPKGWSIPTNEDWRELIKYIKNDHFVCTVGEALKSENQVNSIMGGKFAMDIHPRWDENDILGMDLYSFQAFPGGLRGAGEEALFFDLGSHGYWWTTTHGNWEGYDEVILAILSIHSPHLHLDGYSVEVGASVRLVKHASINPHENEKFES